MGWQWGGRGALRQCGSTNVKFWIESTRPGGVQTVNVAQSGPPSAARYGEEGAVGALFPSSF